MLQSALESCGILDISHDTNNSLKEEKINSSLHKGCGGVLGLSDPLLVVKHHQKGEF